METGFPPRLNYEWTCRSTHDMPSADPYATTRCGRRSANGHAGIFTQIAHFGAAPGGYCANQIADHSGGSARVLSRLPRRSA
jgi:hypothetical protein